MSWKVRATCLDYLGAVQSRCDINHVIFVLSFLYHNGENQFWEFQERIGIRVSLLTDCIWLAN